MLTRLGTRQRAIIGALIIGLITFLLLSGSFKFAVSTILPPQNPSNVLAEERYGEISLAWDKVSLQRLQ